MQLSAFTEFVRLLSAASCAITCCVSCFPISLLSKAFLPSPPVIWTRFALLLSWSYVFHYCPISRLAINEIKLWTQHQRPKQLTLTLDTTTPPGSNLPRKLWFTLNCLRAGVGRFGAEMYKWGLGTSASCARGAASENAEHIFV